MHILNQAFSLKKDILTFCIDFNKNTIPSLDKQFYLSLISHVLFTAFLVGLMAGGGGGGAPF